MLLLKTSVFVVVFQPYFCGLEFFLKLQKYLIFKKIFHILFRRKKKTPGDFSPGRDDGGMDVQQMLSAVVTLMGIDN